MDYNWFIENLKDNVQNFFIFFVLLLFFLIFYFFKYLLIKNKKHIFKFFCNFSKYFWKKISNLSLYKKYPKIFIFIKNRFDRNHFNWLALTIIIFIFLFLFNELIWLTSSILHNWLISKIDIRLSDFFYYFKDSRLINFFLFISYFWTKTVVFLVFIFTSIILILRKKFFEFIWFFFSVWSAVIISFLSKNFFIRPRPELAVYIENWFSFPSFHSAISVALYWFIIWLFILKVKNLEEK